ncbi:aminotransferase class V-fold PLP-dependent enzyme [Rubrivirga sp. IMCC45206]|uniref:aminotransferase class V-fold PLP-dependent enzyme n=1 Tax=Rubrivirga sp. IMCC45206 TaxID=3391614 RepID=UPI0039902AF7
MSRVTPEHLRAQTIGADAVVAGPFGDRPLVYADFTASGRQLAFVEAYLASLAPLYANSHTEDSLTGRTATGLLHDAEATVKRAVGAGPGGKVVFCGNGSTGAIHKLQEILGVAIPPATLRDVSARLTAALGDDAAGRLLYDLRERGPVVFVGPYEHHSNEVMWREGLCTVVEVGLDATGQISLDDLAAQLADPQWAGRRLIGSFSAGSNVTGVLAPVHEIARVLHAADALAVFDYAACGPYVEIDMTPDDAEARLDAVFLSPHKCLGGPGSAGVLVFDEALYPQGLAPTVGGGGTVTYVSAIYHDYTDDVEARETAGTPGLYQALRAAIALDLKRAVGTDTIRDREHAHLDRVLARWADDDRIQVLGPGPEVDRLSILSFNVLDGAGQTLHPRFVTVLLCDLFGIQSRAGCSCAGPYGHRLLGIDDATSARFRQCLVDGINGMKPGWARVGLHFTHSDEEVDYIASAVEFVAAHGRRFLSLYRFDPASGDWTRRDARPAVLGLRLDDVLAGAAPYGLRRAAGAERQRLMDDALAEAARIADTLPDPETVALDGSIADLQFFAVPA